MQFLALAANKYIVVDGSRKGEGAARRDPIAAPPRELQCQAVVSGHIRRCG